MVIIIKCTLGVFIALAFAADFLFLSQKAQQAAFGGSLETKTPVLKLNRPSTCKQPAAIVSDSMQAAYAPFEKPQLAGLRYRQRK